MHDASYYSLAEIKGPEMLLVTMLEMSCDPQGPGPGSKQYVNLVAFSFNLIIHTT
jgi:ribonuclease P/MRP protein subunit POP1